MNPIFKQEQTIRFLRTIGFEPSVSAEIYALPYDKPLKRLMIAREALISKMTQKIETNQ